jgi:hypothetical protein
VQKFQDLFRPFDLHVMCPFFALYGAFEHVELSTYLRVREDGKYLKIIDTNRHQ